MGFRTIFPQKNGTRILQKIERRDNRVRAAYAAKSRLPLCPDGAKFLSPNFE